jgi:acetyltransferase-like isoleucine patch superfamily enzyme
MTQKIMGQLAGGDKGFLGKYRAVTVGRSGWLFLLYFELVVLLFGWMPGLPGLALRAIFYKPLFRRMGRKVAFGVDVRIRNPRNIELGDQVILDDHCVLDAKGEANRGITIGSRVFISRNAIVSCKDGGIRIGDDTTVGPSSFIQSVGASEVTIGHHCSIAAFCYVVGAPDYKHDRTDVPMAVQGLQESQGVLIGNDVWLASSVVVCDGVNIGDGCIVGAHALVRHDLPAYAIAYGVPAAVHGSRKTA